MVNRLNNVTNLPIINIEAANRKTPIARNSVRHSQDTIDFAKAVILGMADLIESQRKFSEKFGLPLNKVFPNSYKALYNNRSKDFVSILFESGSENTDEIKSLFDDLIMHQAALTNALDGIAEEGLAQVSPDTLQSSYGSKVKDAHAWRIFRVYHEELALNANLRFEKIISNGLIKKYTQTRKLHIKK